MRLFRPGARRASGFRPPWVEVLDHLHHRASGGMGLSNSPEPSCAGRVRDLAHLRSGGHGGGYVYSQLLTFGTAFFGSAVESVEALTIILAVGITRGWRYPLYGTLAALGVLVAIVALFGSLLTTAIPEHLLKLVIGTLVLLFGLRWLHKAILRSAGRLKMHDEDKEFAQTISELRRARSDWVGFTIAFKGVFLEGVEVAFIVFAVGSNSHSLGIAAGGGVAAMVLVAVAGVFVRHPLSRVPENTLKFTVGILLATLGSFWAAEGMGVSWPLDFISIFGILAVYLAAARLAVVLIRRTPVASAVVA
ncbi:MAG: COG4280 domain-containing protein [Candidatus Dormibacteria bacterium]